MIWLLVWHAPRDLRSTCWCTALVFVIDAGIYLTRSGLVLFPGAIRSVMSNEVLVTGNYIFGVSCAFLLSTGFTLMLAQGLTRIFAGWRARTGLPVCSIVRPSLSRGDGLSSAAGADASRVA